MRSAFLTCALVLAFLPGFSVPSGAAAPEDGSAPVELYFEAKLLFRDRVMLQRVAIDQWAGGKLLMRARPLGPGTIFELVRPLEDPWTFRWYPTKHEVKLGAAVAVAEPAGHPYGRLAEGLTREARRRYSSWWNDDLVDPGAPYRPEWQERAERFWAERHAGEEDIKDPLHRHPVFPFHVLGEPGGRFGFVVNSDGGVVGGSVTERMSNPWLADGWQAWQKGDRRAGYGYWESERPDWEPRTYEALASALSLLAWSPVAGADTASTVALDPGAVYPITAERLPALVAGFFETLNPRFAGRIGWNGSPTLEFSVAEKLAGGVTVVGDSGDTPVENERKVSYRAWRAARYDADAERWTHDEVQVFAEHRNGSIKVWIRVGYRPLPDP